MTSGEPPVPDAPEAVELVGGAVRIARETRTRPSFLYLDCGAWLGDGKHQPAQRSFGVIAGEHVLLCEFQAGRGALTARSDHKVPDALTRLLAGLAGPQRMDVAVRRWCIAPPSAAVSDDTPTVFLPDMHLPLVGKMPDLDPEMVPDPRLAKCWCHGPIFARIDPVAAARAGAVAPVFRAVGSRLTRNPNEWFYAMAATYNAAAEDLVRFLERLGRLAAHSDVHVVQLGGLFDVWAGFKCVFHSMGFAGLLEPRMVAGAGEREFTDVWRDATLDGRPKDALGRLFRFAPAQRTILASSHGHVDAAAPRPDTAASLHSGAFFAESRPEPLRGCVNRPPHALVGMLEGKAQYFPWTRARPDGWRGELVRASAERWAGEPFGVYVMAHTHVPCLAEVYVDG